MAETWQKPGSLSSDLCVTMLPSGTESPQYLPRAGHATADTNLTGPAARPGPRIFPLRVQFASGWAVIIISNLGPGIATWDHGQGLKTSAAHFTLQVACMSSTTLNVREGAGVLKNERVIHISRRGPAVYKWEVTAKV